MLNSTPFDISPNTHLDEDWFRERWPSLQHQMRDLHGSPVLIDLSAVEWVDPIPLLAIICECGRGVGLGTISLVTLKLGEWGSGEVSARRARVRKYLLHHKWLEAFRRYLATEVHAIYQRNDAEGPRTYVLDEQSGYEQLKADMLADVGSVGLLFTHDALIEPVVFTSGTWADGIRRSVEAVNDSYFRRSTKRTGLRGTTLQRLRACLKELVMNGIEHAYDGVVDVANNPVKPLVAVYARYREVVADTVLAIAGAPLGGAGDGLQPKAIGDAWVELYVVDVGKGLWADAERWSEDEALSLLMRNELRQICRSVNPQPALSEFVWNQKVSKLGRAAGSVALQNRGHLTGLSYLNGVLAINGDFSNWCTGSIWRYGRHPIGDGHHGKLISLAVPFQGTCFRVGLDLKPIQAVPMYWYSPVTHPLVTKTIINRLANESLIGKIIPFALHDLRKSSDSQVSTNVKSLLRVDSLIAGNTLVRVPRHFDKADASTLVNTWLTSVAKTQDASTDFTLVIADLSRAQAMNVEISIADPHSTNDEAVHFQVLADSFPRRVSVILMCEDLAAVAYRVLRLRARQSVTREAGIATFQQLNLRRFDFGRFHSSAERAARLRWAKLMQSVLIQLRSMDSALFWDRANLIDRAGARCVWRNVDWGGGTFRSKLNVYLDFAATMRDRTAARILRRALRRMLALFPNTHLVCVDTLVEGELHNATRYFPINEWPNRNNTNSKLGSTLVGSVRVTGYTLKKHLDGNDAIQHVVDCFVVPEANSLVDVQVSCIRALDWLPSETNEVASERYEQEPGTPFIRRQLEVESSIFDYDALQQGDTFLEPESMYRDFVRDGLIKIGHWRYGDRHSLLEVDLGSALEGFRATINAGNDPEFFGWLRARLAAAFIDVEGPKVVVYPHHRVVRDMVAAYQSVYVDAQYVFIGVNLIAPVAGGLGRIADVTIEHICRSAHPTGKIAFLDIGYLSRRTVRYFKRQLRPAGLTIITELGLMNRSSSPAFASEQRLNHLNTYWRWNVPILGRSDQCAFCAALRAFKHFSERVAHSHGELQRTIEATLDHWNVAGIEQQWRDGGLDPRPLLGAKQVKFGYREISDESDGSRKIKWEEVEHRYSTTLVAHYIEIARYTGNSAPLLNALQNHPSLFDPPTRVELIATFFQLCGKTLEFGLAGEYLGQLTDAVVSLSDWADGLKPGNRTEQDVAAQLFGLACLTLMNLDSRLNTTIARHATRALRARGSYNENAQPLWLPCTGARLYFLAALDTDSAAAARPPLFSMEVCQEPQLWEALSTLLGRGPSHNGFVMAEIKAAGAAGDARRAIDAVCRLAELLGRNDGGLFTNLGISDARKVADELSRFAENLATASSSVGRDISDVESKVSSLRQCLLRHVIRCASTNSDGTTAVNVAATLRGRINSRATELTQIGICDPETLWEGSHQLIWCARVIGELANRDKATLIL